MGKKIISFSVPIDYAKNLAVKNPVREFKEDDIEGYEIDQVIFSTAFNRNRCYFQVSKLLGYANKLTKLMSNINHDLSNTDDRYIPSSEAGYTKIWEVVNDGELEIWGTFRATSPFFVSRKNEFTAPSVELMVDERTAIINENGEYYEDFEWFATAQLAGIPAGSGDARNASEMREFNLDLTPYKKDNIMTEEEVKSLLEEQKKEFSTQLETIKKEFAVVSSTKANMNEVYEWVGSDGNTYRSTYEQLISSVTEMLEQGANTPDDNVVIQMMKVGGLQVIQFDESKKGTDSDKIEEAEKQVNNAMKAFDNAKTIESRIDVEDNASLDVNNNALLSAYNKSRNN